MRKALVTGANGFIGSALCRRLLRDGVAVRALCRTPAKGQSLANVGAEIVGGDVQLASLLPQYVAGCDVIFHVGAALNGGAFYQYNVNVAGTLNLSRAAQMIGVERFVYVSSVAVYGYQADGPVDESHEHQPSPNDYYQQSKALSEAALWKYARQSGLPTVTIRPAYVYGPGSGLWSRQLYNICRRYPVPLVDGGSGHAHPIYIDDVVDLLVTIATHPNAPGNAFHAAPDPAPTWREFIGHYARMAGNKATLELPTNLLIGIGAVVTFLTRCAGHPLDVPGGLSALRCKATFRMNRAADLLSWRPRTSLDEGMNRTEPWLTQQASARLDR